MFSFSPTSQKTRRPRAELVPIANELLHLLEPACERIEIAGSLRRLVPIVGDIELLAIPKIESYPDPGDLFGSTKPVSFNLLWKELNSIFKGKYLLEGDKYRKFVWPAGNVGEFVQVDLFTATPSTWGNQFVIRTGPWEFSKHMMVCLGRQGYTSIDGQVIRLADSTVIPTPDEEKVFELARIPYREPHQRN